MPANKPGFYAEHEVNRVNKQVAAMQAITAAACRLYCAERRYNHAVGNLKRGNYQQYSREIIEPLWQDIVRRRRELKKETAKVCK